MTVIFNAGTVAATSGSANITFTGASLLPMKAQHGDEINIGGTYMGFIDTVDYQAQTATIAPPFVGTTGSGKTYAIRRVTPISVSASETLERTFRLIQDLSVFDTEGATLFFNFNDQTAIANPTAQKMSFNNADPTLVTRVLVSTTEATGKNMQGLMNVWKIGTLFIIRNSVGGFAAYKLSGDATVTSVYADCPVEYVDHEDIFLNNEPLALGFTPGVDDDAYSSMGFPTVHVAANYLRRNAANNGTEYRTPAQVLSDIGAQAAAAPASQAEAEAGTVTSPRMFTPQRIAQAISAQAITTIENYQSTNYTVVKADQGKLISMNSASPLTLSLSPAATLGNGFAVIVKNLGAGLVTIDPSGSEVIESDFTFSLRTNETVIVTCSNGLFFRVVSYTPVTTPFIRTVLDDPDAGSARTTLGAQAALASASQAQAEAGTATTLLNWTPERIRQAITALKSNKLGGGLEYVLTGNSAINASYNGSIIVANTSSNITFTLSSPSTLGAGWMTIISNTGTGNLTITGTFDDGTTSMALTQGASIMLTSNGTVVRKLLKGYGASNVAVPLYASHVGDNTVGPFTLLETPVTPNALRISVGGVMKPKLGFYTLSGDQITFASPVSSSTYWEEEIFH